MATKFNAIFLSKIGIHPCHITVRFFLLSFLFPSSPLPLIPLNNSLQKTWFNTKTPPRSRPFTLVRLVKTPLILPGLTMDPAQPPRSEAPVRGRSSYVPLLNGATSAELAQPTTPSSSSSTLRSSTTDPKTPICSPIPSRSSLSQVAEAGPFTTSMAIEVDTTPRDLLAEINQYTIGRPSSMEVALTGRRSHLSGPWQRRRERMDREEPQGAERAIEDRIEQRRTERRAHRHRFRRHRASSTDVLADSLSTLSTNEQELNIIRGANIPGITRQNPLDPVWVHWNAGRAQPMRDVVQSNQWRVGGMDVAREEGLVGGIMATDVERADTASVYGGPTEDANIQMSYPQFPNHSQSREN